MGYKLSSLLPVLALFEQQRKWGVTEMAEYLGKDRSLIHRYVKELLSLGKIKKVGEGPHTRYVLAQASKTVESKTVGIFDDAIHLSYQQKKILDEIFYKFTPTGEILSGYKGFMRWCKERGLDVLQKVKAYIDIYTYLETQRNERGMLDATDAFQKNMSPMAMDAVYYADQYKWMDFGRGKLAEITFYAKQSQNTSLIKEVFALCMPKLESLIASEKIDAIAITPHSIERKHQLLGMLKKQLVFLGLPFINIIKYYPSKIPIPQKSLKTRAQRIENAHRTIIIDDKQIASYKKVLLIDDFVGSGATLNETAKKLKNEGVEKVIGFAFVGNTDLSYDVINEV